MLCGAKGDVLPDAGAVGSVHRRCLLTASLTHTHTLLHPCREEPKIGGALSAPLVDDEVVQLEDQVGGRVAFPTRAWGCLVNAADP